MDPNRSNADSAISAFNASDAILYGMNPMYGISGFRIVVILLLYITSKKYWLITFWILTIILYGSFLTLLLHV